MVTKESSTRRVGDSGVLERQLSILEVIAASDEGLFLSEIGDALGLPRPTVHRLVAGLADAGLVTTRGHGRKAYVTGPRLMRLLHSNLQTSRLQQLVAPALARLVNDFQETAYLAQLTGMKVRSVAMAVPDREWHGHVYPGNEMPVHASASAKAIFAFQSQDVIERALQVPLRRFTRFTEIDIKAVRRELNVVRDKAYAVCREEIDLGVVAYATPIELPETGVIYSVGVVGPVGRMGEFSDAEVARGLRNVADELSAVLARVSRASGRTR
jgi:DNA-binding IclR family transcriptional regulator